MERRHTERLFSFHRDERGGEVLEWALVSGLLLAAAITTLGSAAARVFSRCQSTGPGW
jgi:hypothetical protein